MQVTKNVTHIGSIIYRAMNGRYIARTCITCKEIKPSSLFAFSMNNRAPSGTCKDCENIRLTSLRKTATPPSPTKHNKNVKKYRSKNAARSDRKVAMIQAERYPNGKKVCTKCKESRSLDNFYKSRGYPDGLTYRCRVCLRANNISRRK